MFYLAAVGIVTLIKALDFIYLFQIKEYRFDRIKSFFSEDGVITPFYLKSPQMPAKSFRNSLLIVLVLMQLVLALLLLSAAPVTIMVLFIIANPFFAFVLVSIAVMVTGIAASYQRGRIIAKASHRLAGSQTVFIGITGSYGKTSIKEFLYEILSTRFPVAKTSANMNTDVGVALSILKYLKPDTKYFITEMGAYRIGEIAKICRLVKPMYAILNPIANQHLGLFGSKENLIKAKVELLQSLPQQGRAYIHIQNQPLAELIPIQCQKIYYGSGLGSDITLNDIVHMSDCIKGKIHYKGHAFPIELRLLGLHNIENVLAAIAVSLDLGMTPQEVASAVNQLKKSSG